MKKSRFFVLAIAALAFAGCIGEDETDTLTQDQASEALDATMAAIRDVDIALKEGIGLEIDTTASCAEGGSVGVHGTVEEFGRLKLDLDFNACVESSITMDGSLDYRFAVASSEKTLKGRVTFSGRVEGTCSLEFTHSYGSTGLTIKGIVCGSRF